MLLFMTGIIFNAVAACPEKILLILSFYDYDWENLRYCMVAASSFKKWTCQAMLSQANCHLECALFLYIL